MKTTEFTLSLLLPVAALCAAAPAIAATPAGQIVQLSGFAMALKPGGGVKVLGSQSVLEVGETLATEQDSYARMQLLDGSEVILGPNTRVLIQSPTSLLLTSGQLQVTPGPVVGGRLTVDAGGTAVDASRGSTVIAYVPDARATLAQRAFARASLAAAEPLVRSDADAPAPLWEPVLAQGVSRPPPAPGALQPGLHVFVIDGMINLTNTGGTQQFATGQFGYVRSNTTPPSIVPTNPALKFSPPPSFSSSSSSPASNPNASKSAAVDCEVR